MQANLYCEFAKKEVEIIEIYFYTKTFTSQQYVRKCIKKFMIKLLNVKLYSS